MALEAAPGGSSKNSESHLIKAEEKNPACCLLLMFKELQPKVILVMLLFPIIFTIGDFLGQLLQRTGISVKNKHPNLCF